MHNGEITGFRQIKRALQMSLPEELFLYPSGYTDAEWAFMLFLSKLKDPHARKFTHTELKNAMMETIATLNTMLKEAGIVSSAHPAAIAKLTLRLVPVCSTSSSVMVTPSLQHDTSPPALPKPPPFSSHPAPHSKNIKKVVFIA